ncbi:hypothetical protein AVEN_106278-1 [Araneus ventricosus]|uniref:Uncharacterized protein n=1 Tax=Araneus ventricosus TaxID=182803 RepID=A0A4Y2TVZ1_ARAVE|nr:hypothetical protein AVEN_106278-1 [Araneus ventricosus]
MPVAGATDDKFEKPFAMIAEIEAGQEAMRSGQGKMKIRMEQEKEEIRNLIRSEKEGMEAHVDCQVEVIKLEDHVNRYIEEVEDIKGFKKEIEEFQGRISDMEKKVRGQTEKFPHQFINHKS